MKCSVFIAVSVDGFIARENGNVDWLQTSENTNVDMSDNPDMGFQAFFNTVDCMIMGRGCMEMISSMELTPEQWPYGDTPIYVLSTTLTALPDNVSAKMKIYSGDITALIQQLDSEGFGHAYIDGGKTVQSFLNAQLITDICMTRVPILLGQGKPLFGPTEGDIHLTAANSEAFANDFVQTSYRVIYSKKNQT